MKLTFVQKWYLKTDPKRLKKELPKAMKGVKSDDRLLLVGTSRCPFDGEMKPLCGLYQRIILIPRPDYASRHCKKDSSYMYTHENKQIYKL